MSQFFTKYYSVTKFQLEFNFDTLGGKKGGKYDSAALGPRGPGSQVH